MLSEGRGWGVLGEKGKGIKEKNQGHRQQYGDGDQRERGRGRQKRVKGGNGEGRRLDFSGEHTAQYTDDVFQNGTPETYNFIN